jgi:hypothetical protein
MFTSKFRHSVQESVNGSKPKAPAKVKSGRKGNWKDQLKLPKSPSPATPFILINSAYEDRTAPIDSIPVDASGQKVYPKAIYFHYKKHSSSYHIGKQERYGDTPCSRGNDPFNPLPCVGCTQQETGNKQVALKDSYAFNALHLVPYHGVPAQDYKTGQFLKKKDTQEFYINYEECTGRDCNYCRSIKGAPIINTPGKAPFPTYPPGSITTEFGRMRYIEVGSGHLSNLEGWDQAITSKCGTCKGELTTEGFECTNGDCATLIIDMEIDPRPADVIAKAISVPLTCPTCKHVGFAKEASFCEACEGAGRASTENTITGVVCKAKRQGEKAKTTIVLDSFSSIEDFEREMPAAHKTLLKGRPLKDVISELSKPFSFEEIMSPVSPEDQVTRLGINYMSSGMSPMDAQGHPGEQNFSNQQ